MRSVSQLASSRTSTTRAALIGAAVAGASAGAGALAGAASSPGSYRGLGTIGGAFFGAGVAGLGGAIVAVTSSNARTRKAALFTTVISLGGIAAALVGSAATRALTSGEPTPTPAPTPTPGPGSNITWTEIPITSALQKQVVYRLSDVATAGELQNPPTLAATQASLGPEFEVDGVWVGSAPSGWVPSDLGTGRVYVEFWVTSGAKLPTGLTPSARLFVQKAAPSA